jgi:hypothetical protein
VSLGKEKQRKKRPKSYSLLFQNFAGHFVTISVKNIKAGSGRSGKIMNVMVAGILLDEDNEYLFLGKDGDGIYAAVKKDEIASVMLTEDGSDIYDIDIPPGSEVQ